MARYRGPKGIPAQLRPLAARGERVRFHGFWLGESARDRRVARWIDEQPNAGEAIKTMIDFFARGTVPPPPAFRNDNESDFSSLEESLLDFED